MPKGNYWELPSNSGREVSRWTVTEVRGEAAEKTYRCDVALEGRFYGDTLGSAVVDEIKDFSLVVRGLQLRHQELSRLVDRLRQWLSLPLAALKDRSLEFSCGMGGLFDQSLLLTLGQRDDTISGGRPVATLAYIVGRMNGELSYPVDPSCLEILADGIERVLECAG
jgi:hypothetical protein